MEFPKLRTGLEAVPFRHEDHDMVLLRDRAGLSDTPLVMSRPLVVLLMHMDGHHSRRDLQEVFARATGELLFTDKLDEILQALDAGLYLENERFAEHARAKVDRFRADPVRRMQLHGRSYPDNGDELRRLLDDFFLEQHGGPGPIETASAEPSRRLLGLVAPHIDLQAGGPTFAHAYKVLADSVSPETWVVLGTGHEPVINFFCLTEKDFETPLGTVPCDREFVAALARDARRDLSAGELNHATEHSIEFQAIFLAHCQPGAWIVPILCSFSHEEWQTERAYIDETAALLRRLAVEHGRSVGFLASVDLAHVGPRYGDPFEPDMSTVTQNLGADRALIEGLERCDASGLMRRIEREANHRKVCGVAPLYMLAKILEGRATGRMLHHTYATVDAHRSFVTFASMAFFDRASL